MTLGNSVASATGVQAVEARTARTDTVRCESANLLIFTDLVTMVRPPRFSSAAGSPCALPFKIALQGSRFLVLCVDIMHYLFRLTNLILLVTLFKLKIGKFIRRICQMNYDQNRAIPQG